MKRKTTLVFAMAVVIAGLLITSAAGLSSIGHSANKEKDFDSADSIAAALRVNPGQIKTLKTAERKELNFEVQKESKAMQTKIVEQSNDMISSEYLDLSVGGMRQPYDSLETHPACADNADGSILLGYQYRYKNYSNPPDFDAFDGVIWEGTNDYGDTWSDGLYWVDDATGDPIAYTYPSADYWGESPIDGGDQYFATQVDVDPGEQGTHVSIMRVNPDPTVNTSYSMRTWTGFADTHRDMSMADIACSNGLYFPTNQTAEPWGLCTYIMDNDFTPATPWDDNAHFFYPVEYEGDNGYALMSWWQDSQYCEGTCAYLDDVTKSGYGVWDPIDSESGQRYFLAMHTVDMNVAFDYPEPDENTYAIGWSLTDPDLGLQHPVIAANDGAVVAAMEVTNATNPYEIMISFWYQSLYNGSVYLDISEVRYLNVTGGGKIQFPEISYVRDMIFKCHVIIDNELYTAWTYDGGCSWGDFYKVSGDDIVISEYRAVDLSENAAISVWEYDDSSGGDYIIRLHYMFNTFRLDGFVTYEDGTAVDPCSVTVENLDSENGWSRDASTDGNYYWLELIPGFDIWTNATFRMTGRDEPCHAFEGAIEHTFTEIYLINTHNITVYPNLPGDCDGDGDVDMSDLATVLRNYGTTSGATWEMGDFDGDGDVDIYDLVATIENFDPDCVPIFGFVTYEDGTPLDPATVEITDLNCFMGCQKYLPNMCDDIYLGTLNIYLILLERDSEIYETADFQFFAWDDYGSIGAVHRDGFPDLHLIRSLQINITVEFLPGDLDQDGDVDLSDLAMLLAHYGMTCGVAYEDGDTDGDCDVDLSDLATLLANYGHYLP